MSVYLDASVLVALLIDDPLSARADAFLRQARPVPVVSEFAIAEVASAIARQVRMGNVEPEAARVAFATLDAWVLRGADRPTVTATDMTVATTWLRRLDLNLRTPDAINLAIAQRLSATVATFDAKMSAVAEALGLPVAPV